MKGIWECGVRLKTRDEIRGMAAASALAGAAVRRAGLAIRPGVPLEEVRARAHAFATTRGARNVLVCTSLNDTAAHGLPGNAILRDGDVLTVDASVCRDGWYGDVAWTFIVGRGSRAAQRLVSAAWEAAWDAVRAIRGGASMSDLGCSVREAARRHLFSVAEECAGHGIGRALHEAPDMAYANARVEGFLVPGMVFTVEPVLTAGAGLLRREAAGEGLVTADGSLAAQFELTVALLASGPVVLSPPCGEEPGVDRCGGQP